MSMGFFIEKVMKHLFTFAIIFFFVSVSFGQKIRRVEGEFKMKVESNMSMNDARRMAVQQAQLEALKAEFGTRIGMMNQTRMESSNGNTNTSFSSIANSLVKGLWLKDIQEPEFKTINDGEDQWISVKVVGRARSLDKAGISFEVKPLKCDNINCESQEFNHGEELLLYFRSPESGYLTVFIDDKSTAFQVLPYKSMDVSNVKIEADKEYYFFKADNKYNYYSQELTQIDEYNLVTDYDYEVDLIYVLFSKEPFSKPILDDYGPEYPKMTESKKFNDWLADIMSYESMYMEVIDVSVAK
jgi:hypothetical protein